VRPDHLSYRRLVKSALVGALIGVVFDLAVAFLTRSGSAFTLRQIPSYVAFGIVGFAGGWLFELFKAQTEVTDESVRALREVQGSVEQLTRRLTYQDEALTMLSAAPRHNEVLTALIKASLWDSFRSIPYVGVPAYLRLLGLAIKHAETYEGTHRTTFRWFIETDAGHYLNGLRDKAMSVKTRLVLIEDAELDAMREDLANPEVMDYYWRHTGDVETYWMTVSEFRKAFPRRDVPRDLALYDRELWVAYDEATQTLSFDVVPEDAEVCRLFADLREMITRGQPELKRVERP
jgi:hypothetical protein